MAYIVADPCIKCKYTDCVAVCPVDCFYEGENFLAIHPEECIDCGACEPECPTTAIFEESALPEKWAPFVTINSVYTGAVAADDADTSGWPQALIDAAEAPGFRPWPNIVATKDPLPEADRFAEVANKIGDLASTPGAR